MSKEDDGFLEQSLQQEVIAPITTCSCLCCTNFDVPHQPADLEKSKTLVMYGQQKSYSRSIQASWYRKHAWISVCTSSYKIFCQVCCRARNQRLITFSKHCNLTFVEDGFSCWKKALQRFMEHEKSDMHREAVMKLAAKSNAVDVSMQLISQHTAEKRNNRAMFLKVLECARYLARQGLPLRGHHEDSTSFEGNLYQLLLLQAKDCPSLGLWLKRREYISPEIINEIIAICGKLSCEVYCKRSLPPTITHSLLTKLPTSHTTSSCVSQFVGLTPAMPFRRHRLAWFSLQTRRPRQYSTSSKMY